MDYGNILFEPAGEGCVRVTVNRPQKLNALNTATMAELDHAFARIEADPAVRGLILTGAGGKAFVAGADIAELVDAPPVDSRARCLRDQATLRRLERMGKPSIAAINGYALGGGLELALSCTIRVAAETARLGLPEIKLGILPGNGGTQRLPRLVGRGTALELMLTGRHIDAAEAHRIGLVNHVVPAAELAGFCANLMAAVLENAPLAARLIMECVDAGLDCGLEEGLRHEATAFGVLASTEDRREGTRAFLEKRKPAFGGR